MPVLLVLLAALSLFIWSAIPHGRGVQRAPRFRSRAISLPTCRTPQLRVSFADTFAGLGHVTGLLRFTNIGRARCQLSGWPSVAPVEANGSTVRSQRIPAASGWGIIRSVPRRVRPVVLEFGRSSYVEVSGGDVPLRDDRWPCPAARSFQVTAPGDDRHVTVSAWVGYLGAYFPLCAGAAVTPFLPPSVLPHH